jgi:hypothetical protein
MGRDTFWAAVGGLCAGLNLWFLLADCCGGGYRFTGLAAAGLVLSVAALKMLGRDK